MSSHLFDQLVRDVGDAFGRPIPADPKPLLDSLAEALRRLIQAGLFLDERYQRPSQEGFAGHEVHRDARDRFPIATGVWLPNQATPIHSHGGAGVIAALHGRVIVTNYRRSDDGLTPGYASLSEWSRILVSDQSHSRFAAPDDAIHKIENPGPHAALTLHVTASPGVAQLRFAPRDKTVVPLEGRPELASV